MRVISLIKEDGLVAGAIVRDVETGRNTRSGPSGSQRDGRFLRFRPEDG